MQIQLHLFWSKLIKAFKLLAFGFGVLFLLMLMISFTSWPYWGIYHLATHQSDYNFEPEYIVVMGGSGMPSKSALIRMYHAAVLAQSHPESKVIIALPDTAMTPEGPLLQMKKELRLRQVNNEVLFENRGTNTRSQALNIKQTFNIEDKPTVVVSAPEHLYRTILSFKKIGFKHIGGQPAFESDLKCSLDYNSKTLGGQTLVPDVGNNTQLRYQFWNHLQYEILLLREYTAIAYYKINSWIW